MDRRPLLRLGPSLLLLHRDHPALADPGGPEPRRHRPGHRGLDAVGAQVSLGSADRPLRRTADLDPGLPGAARGGHRGLRGSRPDPPRRRAGGAAPALRDALRHPGRRGRRIHHRDDVGPRAGRRQLGPDRRVPGGELRLQRAAGLRRGAAGMGCGVRGGGGDHRRARGGGVPAAGDQPREPAGAVAGRADRGAAATPGRLGGRPLRPDLQARHLRDGPDDQAVLDRGRALAERDRGAHHWPA